MSQLKVVEIYDHNYRDPVATLRHIADSIENGEYGDVGTAALVLLGDKMEVFGFGRDSEGPSVALLLHSGFLRISQAIEKEGRE